MIWGGPMDTSISYTTLTPSPYKVNSIPYVTSLLALMNGLLLDTPIYIHDRSTSTSTEIKEARGLKPDKSHAWKRRRKRRRKKSWKPASGTTAHHTAVLPLQLPCPSIASPKMFSSKYARQRYYRPWMSGTTARAVLLPVRERYYRQPAAVLPALRNGFQPELSPVVSLRPNYYI